MADSIRKRTGNDISVTISVIYDNGQAQVDLSSYRYEIWLCKRFGRRTMIPQSSITANADSGTLSFVWKASDQHGCGDWSVLLRLFKQSGGENTGSGNSIDRTCAITLTEHTCQDTDGGNSISIEFAI